MNPQIKEKALSVLKGLVVLFFWLAVWAVIAHAVNKELILPVPLEVAKRFFVIIFTLEFWQIAFASLLRIIIGFVGGMLAGILLAVLMNSNKFAAALLAPLIKVVRATPVVSFIILALVWIVSNSLPVFISFLMVLPVAWANTLSGIENTDRQLLEMASLYKVKKLRIWRKIYFPSIQPYLLAAVSSGLGLAWKSGITAEVIAAPRMAIGSELQAAKVYLESADTFVWTIVVVIMSIILEKIITALISRRQAKYPAEEKL